MAVCSFLCFCRLFSTAEAAVYMFSMKRCPPGIWPSHKRYGVCRGVWVWHWGRTGLQVQSGGFTSCPTRALEQRLCPFLAPAFPAPWLLARWAGARGPLAPACRWSGVWELSGCTRGQRPPVLCPLHQGLWDTWVSRLSLLTTYTRWFPGSAAGPCPPAAFLGPLPAPRPACFASIHLAARGSLVL